MQVSVSDGRQSLAELVRSARQEPVVLRLDGEDVAVLLSASEYRRIQRANWEAFSESGAVVSKEARENGLTEEKLSELLAEIDAETPR